MAKNLPTELSAPQTAGQAEVKTGRQLRLGLINHCWAPIALFLFTALASVGCQAYAQNESFPEPSEVFQGRIFHSRFEQALFFLRRIRQDYPQFWSSLISENITLRDYIEAPQKMQEFIEQLVAAVSGLDDLTAITNLAEVVSNPTFYANTNAYRPDLLGAAASALIKMGPSGQRILADCFTEKHYQMDAVSLEVMAGAIGRSGSTNLSLQMALAAAAFTLTATNGGSYPRCTTEGIRNLLLLPKGASRVVTHLNPQEVFKDPGRFQEVIDAISAAGAVNLSTNLVQLETQVAAKLKVLPTKPDPYRDDLLDLQARTNRAIESLKKVPSPTNTAPQTNGE